MLKVDPEFAAKIPPLTEEEFRQLEENILTEGRIITPIIVWGDVIVDGHNRYRIACTHPEIVYSTYQKDFPDRCSAIAAHVTTGAPLMGLAVEEPGPVLMLSVEDDAAVLRGRFEADGGDMRRHFFLDHAYALSFGSPEVEQAIQSTGAKLVVFDPLQNFLGANVDFHKANQTRPIMAALAALAERNRCGVAVIAHAGKAMAFTIGERGKVEWRGFRDVGIRDLERSGHSSAGAREDCKAFILNTLKAGEMSECDHVMQNSD